MKTVSITRDIELTVNSIHEYENNFPELQIHGWFFI